MDLACLISPEAQKVAAAAKAKAVRKRYPNAGMSKFVAEAYFLLKTNATADVLYIEGPDSWQSVSLAQEKCW